MKKEDRPCCQTWKLKDGTTEAFHRTVALSLATGTYYQVMAFTRLTNRDTDEKAEGKLTGAKKDSGETQRQVPGFLDLIIEDALYANAPIINAIMHAGANAVVRIKGDDRKLIRNAEKHFGKGDGSLRKASRRAAPGRTLAGDRCIGPLFHVRSGTACEACAVTQNLIPETGDPDCRIGKDGRLRCEERTVYMISTDLEVSAADRWKLSHNRWDIENSIFHTMSTKCHVKHMFWWNGRDVVVHGGCVQSAHAVSVPFPGTGFL